jgi:hypothetical protein
MQYYRFPFMNQNICWWKRIETSRTQKIREKIRMQRVCDIERLKKSV